MGTFLLISIRKIHSKRGKFYAFSSGLPSDQGYEFGRGQAWSGVLLAVSRHTLRLRTTGREPVYRQVRAGRETGTGGCLSYLDVTERGF